MDEKGLCSSKEGKSIIGSIGCHAKVEKSKGAGPEKSPLKSAILIYPVKHAIDANQQRATTIIHSTDRKVVNGNPMLNL